jgi:hypothetical protein
MLSGHDILLLPNPWIIVKLAMDILLGDGGFYPSTQRHYRRLVLLLILLHVPVVRPSSGRNIFLGSISSKINLR